MRPHTEQKRSTIMLQVCMSHRREEVCLCIVIVVISIWCDDISLIDQILEEKYFFRGVKRAFFISIFHMTLVESYIQNSTKILWFHESVHRVWWVHRYYFLAIRFGFFSGTGQSSMIRSTSASTSRISFSRSSSISRIFWKFDWNMSVIA